MESSARQVHSIRLATEEDLPRILELSRMWPENFIAETFSAIEQDFREHHCCVYESHGAVQAYIVFSSTYYEIEMLWGATNRDLFHRAAYLYRLIRWVDKNYFEEAEHRRVICIKMATLDSKISHAPLFAGEASKGIHGMFRKLGYRMDARIDSFWFPGDHCVLAIKTKHTNEKGSV